MSANDHGAILLWSLWWGKLCIDPKIQSITIVKSDLYFIAVQNYVTCRVWLHPTLSGNGVCHPDIGCLICSCQIDSLRANPRWCDLWVDYEYNLCLSSCFVAWKMLSKWELCRRVLRTRVHFNYDHERAEYSVMTDWFCHLTGHSRSNEAWWKSSSVIWLTATAFGKKLSACAQKMLCCNVLAINFITYF